MTPEQLHELLNAIRETQGSGFNWIQGVMALGATLVSVTGVVVGMRSAIASLAKQLDKLGDSYESLSGRVASLSERMAVLEYAEGVQADIPARHERES